MTLKNFMRNIFVPTFYDTLADSIMILFRLNNFSIRGLSGKYRAYLYISAQALFFIIGRVAYFKVIPT